MDGIQARRRDNNQQTFLANKPSLLINKPSLLIGLVSTRTCSRFSFYSTWGMGGIYDGMVYIWFIDLSL